MIVKRLTLSGNSRDRRKTLRSFQREIAPVYPTARYKRHGAHVEVSVVTPSKKKRNGR